MSIPANISTAVFGTVFDPDKKHYTLKEAAVYLNISTRTVERLIQRGLIRKNKALGKILISRTQLDDFIEKLI